MATRTYNIYRHSKGGLYRKLHEGFLEKTTEPVVIYESLADNKIWVRPTSEFNDGRFVLATYDQCRKAKIYGDLTEELLIPPADNED